VFFLFNFIFKKAIVILKVYNFVNLLLIIFIIVASTWGASFTRARLLYNSTVRLVIIYGAAAWLTPERSEKGAIVQAIQKVQNKGL
jgi:hypothetical protein